MRSRTPNTPDKRDARVTVVGVSDTNPDHTTTQDPTVRAEIEALLSEDPRQLGQVFRQVQQGLTAPKNIVEAGAAKNTGAVSNLRQTLAALLDGTIPESATVARQAAAAVGWFLTADLSDPTRQYLEALRSTLVERSRSGDAMARDAHAVQSADRELSRRAQDLSGVYVYSFLHYLQYPNDEATGRCWLKVGSTNRGVWQRVINQARQTSMPEDPKLLRIYHSVSLAPEDIEARFHTVLDAAGHDRSSARHSKAGVEWFSTTVEMLDALAEAMGLAIERLDD